MFLRRMLTVPVWMFLVLALGALAWACGGGDGDGDQPTPTPTATVAPSPTSMPSPTPAPVSILIRLSKRSSGDPQTPIRLEVITGDYVFVNGSTVRAGSDVAVGEDWLTFPSGLAIDVGSGGVTLGNHEYPEGTRLRVAQNGALVEVDEE